MGAGSCTDRLRHQLRYQLKAVSNKMAPDPKYGITVSFLLLELPPRRCFPIPMQNLTFLMMITFLMVETDQTFPLVCVETRKLVSPKPTCKHLSLVLKASTPQSGRSIWFDLHVLLYFIKLTLIKPQNIFKNPQIYIIIKKNWKSHILG